jgi:two-component system LytT family response regulator
MQAIDLLQFKFPMKNLKAIIVDEERLARVNLKRLLMPFPEIEIAGEAGSCADALELISLYDPQLIFLDLQLQGETGFDLVKLIDKSIKIIFVTAYDESSLRTFEVNSVDYLSKPVNPELLKEAIGKVKKQIKQPEKQNEKFCMF